MSARAAKNFCACLGDWIRGMNLDEMSDTLSSSNHTGVLTGVSQLHPFDDNRSQIILLHGAFRKFNNRLV